MVKIYHFKVYDAMADEYVVPPLKSTRERIERIRGEIIPGTEEDVEPSQLGDDGKVRS